MGGKGIDPTVISPEQYKQRFREAINFYLTPVPSKFASYVQSHSTVDQEEQEKGE